MKIPKSAQLGRPKRKELIKICDELCRQIVKIRDGGKCQVCGKKEVHVAHIYSKGANPSLRFNPLNLVLLCPKHHLYWAHRSPIEFSEWVKNHLGEEKFFELRKQANLPVFKLDLNLVKIELEQKLKNIKQENSLKT